LVEVSGEFLAVVDELADEVEKGRHCARYTSRSGGSRQGKFS
jgi:hypothetical protein